MHDVVQGDCLDVMREMPSRSVDAIITDPPFNTGRDFGAYDDRWREPQDARGLDASV